MHCNRKPACCHRGNYCIYQLQFTSTKLLFDLQDLPDLKDQEAVQKFFLDEVSKGEQYLAEQKFELCVKHLTNAIAVCGQPQQLLQVFRNMLPPNVFQMLISNLALLGSAQMNQMVGGPIFNDFGPRVYPMGSIVIARVSPLVRPLVCL